MTEREFVTIYVLLSLSTKSNLVPTESIIADAINAWNLLQKENLKDE